MSYQQRHSMIDIIGGLFWFGILGTPLLAYWMAGRDKHMHWVWRVVLTLVVTVILAIVFYHIALSIIFRDGMGPG